MTTYTIMPNYANSQAYNFLNPTFFAIRAWERVMAREKSSCFQVLQLLQHVSLSGNDYFAHFSQQKRHLFASFTFIFLFIYFLLLLLCSLPSLFFFPMVSYYLAQIWLVFVFEKKAYNKTCFNSFNLYWTERKGGEREVADVLTFI